MAAKAAHRRTVLRVIVVAELVVALLTGAAVAYGYQRFEGNITRIAPAPHPVSKPKVDGPKEPLNVLILGSDSRDGAGNDLDGLTGGGQRADMTILLHASADRKRVYGVSIPRDTIVDRPDCDVDGKQIAGEQAAMWNTAFAVGGAACTRQMVEKLTGVYVDHTVVVDFGGFVDMVDAVNGVEICVPKEVDDPAHGIHLDAGRRIAPGKQALAYVRERHVLSANSDIGRMRRQQAFVASMVNRVLSANTLAVPTRLFDFLDAATSSLSVDDGLDSLKEIADLMRQFQHTGLSHIKFVTVPFESYPADPNRLQLAPDAHRLWRVIRDDQPLGALSRGAITANDNVGTPGKQPTTPQARERVDNGLCA